MTHELKISPRVRDTLIGSLNAEDFSKAVVGVDSLTRADIGELLASYWEKQKDPAFSTLDVKNWLRSITDSTIFDAANAANGVQICTVEGADAVFLGYFPCLRKSQQLIVAIGNRAQFYYPDGRLYSNGAKSGDDLMYRSEY